MTIPTMLVGLALLTVGRRLFWVFVGAAGFIFGSTLASQFLIGQSAFVIVGVGLAAGLVGIVLAIFAQHLAVGVAGFVMGSYVLTYLLSSFGGVGTDWTWLAVVGGGVIGAVLVVAFFDFALIALSTLAGAELIVQVLNLERLTTFVLFIVLVAIGAAIQVSTLRTKRR
jgi:hypothetical protein